MARLDAGKFLHGGSRLSATGVIVLLEKGTQYG